MHISIMCTSELQKKSSKLENYKRSYQEKIKLMVYSILYMQYFARKLLRSTGAAFFHNEKLISKNYVHFQYIYQ